VARLAFAARTRRELVATGETVRKAHPETRGQLTAQELQIALLALVAPTAGAGVAAVAPVPIVETSWRALPAFEVRGVRV
jgi:hypothetical protein